MSKRIIKKTATILGINFEALSEDTEGMPQDYIEDLLEIQLSREILKYIKERGIITKVTIEE